MIDWCRPNVLNTMDELKPKCVILLGSKAVRSVIGELWKEDVGGIKVWAGFRIPNHRPNAWVAPTFHPSFVMRQEKDKGMTLRFFERHLKAAFDAAESRPWKEVPDYEKQVTPIYSPTDAAKVIRRFIRRGGNVAFDIETTCLKPDGEDAQIVAASLCHNGEQTIAYPWAGDAIQATKELLLSDVGIISHNMKFEDRWVMAKLGIKVKRWVWDSMAQAHVLDCRKGVKSLKFQAFARLGQPSYDDHIKPFLQGKEKSGGSQNRVKEIDMMQLLTYCGLDSLLCYLIAVQQAKELNVTLGEL
jgi:hypothetical protein